MDHAAFARESDPSVNTVRIFHTNHDTEPHDNASGQLERANWPKDDHGRAKA